MNDYVFPHHKYDVPSILQPINVRNDPNYVVAENIQ